MIENQSLSLSVAAKLNMPSFRSTEPVHAFVAIGFAAAGEHEDIYLGPVTFLPTQSLNWWFWGRFPLYHGQTATVPNLFFFSTALSGSLVFFSTEKWARTAAPEQILF